MLTRACCWFHLLPPPSPLLKGTKPTLFLREGQEAGSVRNAMCLFNSVSKGPPATDMGQNQLIHLPQKDPQSKNIHVDPEHQPSHWGGRWNKLKEIKTWEDIARYGSAGPKILKRCLQQRLPTPGIGCRLVSLTLK